MKPSEFMKYYIASPLGVGCAALSAAAGAFVGFGLGLSWGLLAGIGCFVAALSVSALSGAGSRAAVGERERRDWADAAQPLEAVRAAKERLASMRIPDPTVKLLAQAASLRAGEYYAACLKGRTHDPRADFAAAECLELLDAFLAELDASSTEKRFSLPDAEPFLDAASRVRASLEDRVAILAKAALDIRGGLSPKDQIEIKEQL